MNALASEPPEDLAEFWNSAVQEALTLPLNYRRSLTNDYDRAGFQVECIEFDGVDGRRLSGWYAFPAGGRRLPAFVWVPPYGRESVLPNEYGTRDGFASLSFNFHGLDAFHQEKYVTARGYFAEGVESPETWIFRTMFQNLVIAAKVLQAMVEVDETRIGSMGMSQGGGMSIWLGAWCPIIRAVCADMPFLGEIDQTLRNPVYRYPLKELTDAISSMPLGEARVLNTVNYYDTVHHAAKCMVPTQVSLGLRDPASRPEKVRMIFDALPGSKTLRTYEGGHDWHREMIDNNRSWLLDNLKATP